MPQTNMDDTSNAPKDGLSPEEKETPVVETPENLESLNPKEDKDDRVPLNKYMAEKNARRDAEAQAEQLQSEIAKLKMAGMTGNMPIPEVNEQLRKLAEEHNVDEAFLTKLLSTVETATIPKIKAELEKDYAPKLAKLEQKDAFEQASKKFEELYARAIKDMPDYDGIVNKEVIKSLAFNPANAKKNLPQIMEEAYGTAIQGRKTIETARTSREPDAPNVVNPTTEDWEKIQSDPKAKEAWAKSAEQQIRDYL